MAFADWVILLFLAISVVGAAIQGFFCEAFSIAGLVAGYIVAAWQYPVLAEWFAPHLKSLWTGDIAAFLIIFFAVLMIAGIAGQIIHWAVRKAGLNSVDRMLGAVLGLVRGTFVVAIVLVAMTAFAPAAKWLEGSELAPYFLLGGRAVIWLAPSELRQRFFQGLDYMRQAHSETEGFRPKAGKPVR